MHERRAAEMRAVAGGLEAPAQMVTIVVLGYPDLDDDDGAC